MPLSQPELPAPVRLAVSDLWGASFKGETGVFNSARFYKLVQICSSVYPSMAGSRIPAQPKSEFEQRRVGDSLQRFFRWTGAPWYEGDVPDAAQTALRLHSALLAPNVKRTYFTPLDRLDLTDITRSVSEELQHVAFGPCEIALLDQSNLAARIPITALQRFDERFHFPAEQLAGFFWLVVPETEPAGPMWHRSWAAILDTTWGEIGRVLLYEPTYAALVEDAVFVLLLCLVKNPSDSPWEPFLIPWVYSLTDDPFAEPPRAPDPATLTWDLVGDEDHEVELPARREDFEFEKEDLQRQLDQRWNCLHAGLQLVGTQGANFHPLTKHFFVKAFAEQGMDQVIANLSCIEATLQLSNEKNRTKLMKRYKRLVADETAHDWLEDAYNQRNKYLHSLGQLGEAIGWHELAKTRWAICRAVDEYLALTEQHNEMSRSQLLHLLLP